jgi:hypothetical protein
MQSECNQYQCCNCQIDLLPFITRDNRYEGYCRNHECNFSTNYDQNYLIAWQYYETHGQNIGGFRFDGEIFEEIIDDVIIKPTVYNLDFS